MTHRQVPHDPVTLHRIWPKKPTQLAYPLVDRSPRELPADAELTNDPELWEERSRPCTEREAREEVDAQQDNGAFG